MHTILQAPQHQPRAPLQSWDRLSRSATYSLRYMTRISMVRSFAPTSSAKSSSTQLDIEGGNKTK